MKKDMNEWQECEQRSIEERVLYIPLGWEVRKTQVHPVHNEIYEAWCQLQPGYHLSDFVPTHRALSDKIKKIEYHT